MVLDTVAFAKKYGLAHHAERTDMTMLTVSAVAFAYPELISKRLAPLYDAVCIPS